MSGDEENALYDIGLVGLGTMGSNFALNVADHGFSVAGYNRKGDTIKYLADLKKAHQKIAMTQDIAALCRMVRPPRTIVLLVPAGGPVDAVIEELAPHLIAGDLIVDSGNSHFTDTDRRSAALQEKGLLFVGMGMSGGESGARHGPSLMPGGNKEGYDRIAPILEAAAAQVEAGPCVAYMGVGSAGHYVKMVHNGIEYALMQLIAESYDLLRRGLGMESEALGQVYHRWNQGVLNSYLMEITAAIFARKDESTGAPLIDMIADAAKQKGTGQWTVADALAIQVPTLTIDTAVMMRHMSGYKEERTKAASMLSGPLSTIDMDRDAFIDKLENALYCAVIVAYAQGMALLQQASLTYRYDVHLPDVARVWTGGCIIRAALLKEIQQAYQSDPKLDNLLLAQVMHQQVHDRQKDWRAVVATGIASGLPVPGLASALAYWDAYRSGWLPANLIMAQRDYFGAHTYQRTDGPGLFHTKWEA